jgi:hypothetical protein
MANIGAILAGALAGAAQGGGEAAQRSLYSMQDAQQREDLVKMQNQLDEQKQMRILEAQQSFAKEQQGALFAHQDQSDEKQRTWQTGEKQLDRSSEEKRTGMSTAAQLEAARIHVGGTLAAERMRIAAQRSGEDKPVLVQTENGPILVNPKTGTGSPITDTTTGKPIGTMRMSELDKTAYASAIKTANNDLANPEDKKAAMATARGIEAKYSSGGALPSTAPAVDFSKIPPGAITRLKQIGDKEVFDSKYGPGAADAILGGGKKAAAPNPFTSDSVAPGAGAVKPPLPAVRPSAGLIGGAAGAVGTNTQAGIMPGVGPVDAYGRPIIK